MNSKSYDIDSSKMTNMESGTTEGSSPSTYRADKKWSAPRCCNVFTIAMTVAMFIVLVGFIVILVLYFTADTARSEPMTDGDKTGRGNATDTKTDSYVLSLRADCHGTAYWFRADTHDCRRYYQCYKGEVSEFTCSPGYAFLAQADNPECVYPWLANCGERPYVTGDEEFRLIRLTLIIRNNVTENVTVGMTDVTSMATMTLSSVVPRNPLYYCMLLLNGTDGFSFEASHSNMFGEYLASINGLTADNARGTYWQLLANDKPLTLGISTYIPADDDVITFIYSLWHDNHA